MPSLEVAQTRSFDSYGVGCARGVGVVFYDDGATEFTLEDFRYGNNSPALELPTFLRTLLSPASTTTQISTWNSLELDVEFFAQCLYCT